jgi:hypothetical protein
MERRSLIKGILALGATGVIGFSGYKWLEIKEEPSLENIDEDRALLAYLAETVIPETDTPGALSAGVEVFMIRALKDFLPRRDVNRFLDGIEKVKELANEAYHKRFEDCSQQERESILIEFEDSGIKHPLYQKIQDRFLGRPFIRILKFLVCTGFAFSKIGATQAFNYESIPGAYQPNIPLKEGQPSMLLT